MFIEKIFRTLSKSNKKEFLTFLERKRKKTNRKDVEVCEDLINFKTPKIENRNNYHATRNRIKKELIIFLFLKQIEDDETGESELLNEINLCRYLFNNHLEKEAWSYIKKTEKKALQLKSNRVLYSIYVLMLEFSDLANETINIEKIIEEKKRVKTYLDKEDKLIDTLAIARKKLLDFKTNAQEHSLVRLLQIIQSDIDLNHSEFYEYPKQVCGYLELVRNTLLYNRDIRELEPIAIKLYTKTKVNKAFTKQTIYYELRILYIVCHSLYRNHKWEETLKYINLLEERVTQSKQAHYYHYYAKIAALNSSVYFLTGRLEDAIEIIEDFFEDEKPTIRQDELNLKLNLLTYYAYNKEYKKANRIFIQMHHSDGWYRKIMGQEWVFKKNSIEMLLQFEMGKDDIALNRINGIIKANNELVSMPQYQGIMYFLKLFKKYIENPDNVTEKDLLQFSNNGKLMTPDNEMKKTAFYAWFLAKVKDKDPYTFLLNQVLGNS